MLNRVILIGRLTRDPELRYTQNGYAQTRFTLAVDRDYTNHQGERETDFIPIVAWNKLGEIVVQNLNKGRLIAVEGKMRVRSYEDKEGGRRYVTEVIADSVEFLEKKQERNEEDYKPTYDEEGNELREVPF